MKLKLGNSLTDGGVAYRWFKKFYQALFLGKSTDISGSEAINYGTGGSDVNVDVTNVQVATFDGTAYLQGVSGSFLGLGIGEYSGTAIPIMDSNTDRIYISAGTLEWLKLTNGETFYFQESNGINIYSILGTQVELTTILDVFSQAPQLIGSDYYFVDESGFGNNIKITKNPCGLFQSTNNTRLELAAGIIDLNQTSWDIEFSFMPSSTTGGIMFSFTKNLDPNKSLSINWNSPLINNEIFVYIGSSTAIRDTIIGTAGETVINLKLSRRNDLYTLNQSGKSKSITATYTFIDKLLPKITIGCRFLVTYDVFFGGLISNFKYTENEIVKVYIPNTRNGLDVTGNENHATPSATDLNLFKTGTIDGTYPYHLAKGFSFNGTEIIPALLDGSADAQGNPIQYPIRSGIVDGLSNEYVIPVNEDLNTIIASGNYTWEQIDALMESANLIKSKTGSQITNLVVKKKLSSSGTISVLTEEITLTDESILI